MIPDPPSPEDPRASPPDLFDHFPFGFCTVDGKWGICVWNRVLEGWTGMRRAAVIGKPLFEPFPHLTEPRFRGRLEMALGGSPPVIFSPRLNAPFFPCQFPDGSLRRQKVTVTRACEGDERQLLITVEDETENLKQLELVNRLHAEALAEVVERRRVEIEREKLISELQEALAKVKALKGLIPICANCKKVRNDTGYWQNVEQYIEQHSEADFTHGLCPDCMKKLYPDLAEDEPR